ncbi:acyl-phosphate glycerol-3-phosphate acyltransferase [Magnetococcus marinus MC-1]|uniref:Glycerol-3-phosphate acyltransferase n=1 Tax=Magnetococcus marinus (strain ATCC BAA-1437 / JCM 17883 / MC-1) TaxID=156889 RepID=A0LDV4_MAGMM|nr:glycerol-3-phosphate 1-O-acyltransferase PlsY [Magnetococcus marinus]ABK46147.1 acyl-phosphate glycerol-3-phosphate acyltransferase [Magnetococcus marinus MC-1]
MIAQLFTPTALMAISAAYLLGAVPFGLVIARLWGVGDIRTQGSGNIGATNVLRTAGKIPGLLTLVLDIGKGAMATAAGIAMFGWQSPITAAMALLSFMGHLYPVYLGFKGGKGVATGLGVFLMLTPVVGLLAVGSWVVGALLFRISSLAALIAFAMMPLYQYLYGTPAALVVAAIVVPMVFWKHRQNIQRILQGTEPRIGKKG